MQMEKHSKNIKKITILCLFLMTITSIFATQHDLNTYEYLKLEINNDIYFEVNKDSDLNINYFEVNSNFLPITIEDAQYLNKFETNIEEYDIYNETKYYIKFSLNEKTLNHFNEIENKFTIESILFKPQIKNKEQYPSTRDYQDYKEYINFFDLIDTSSDIKNKASQLAQNEDDVYVIAVKIASWIKDYIEYDLSTVTQNPNQKSSEVFVSRQGVCKESTNLFVSMMRSLGIPARVVTGYAYTTAEDVVSFVGSNWGGHAWAEVLIDDEWVPFDLTYNQYGYVDATHIIIDQSDHIRENSVTINASGYGFDLVDNSLKIENKFNVLDHENKIFDFGFNIEIDGPQKLASGSFGYLEINIENKKDYYQVIFLKLAKTKEIELLSKEERLLILKPKEKKKIYFKYKVPKLDSGFIYTFPFSIYNENYEQKFNLSVKDEYEHIDEVLLPEEINQEINISNNKVNLDCVYLFDMPKNKIKCYIKNTNNYEIKNLELCNTQGCIVTNLLLNEQKEIVLDTPNFAEKITCQYEKNYESIMLYLKEPELITNYSIQGKKLVINSSIKNTYDKVTISIYNNQTLITQSVHGFEEYELKLNPGLNDIDIKLEYETNEIDKKNIKINVENKPLSDIIDKIIAFFKNLFN